MSFINKGKGIRAHGHLAYSDRFETVSETEWDQIEELERDQNLGRDIFRCFVLDASDYVDPSVGDAVGSYIRAVLMPVDWMNGNPYPCDPQFNKFERSYILSNSIIGKSETKLGDTRHMPLNPGDVVHAYWNNPDKPQEGVVFMLDKIERDKEGNYLFECLKVERSKPSLNYKTNASPLGKNTVPVSTTEPFKIKKHSACYNWETGPKRWTSAYARNKFGIPAGGVNQVFNGRFNQIPNCKSCYRGGQFRKASLVHEINALKDLGVRVVYRFNREEHLGQGEPTKAEEQAAVQAAGLKYVYIPLTGNTVIKKAQWITMKDELVKGGVYFHCHAGVDRTGAIAARWILETSMVWGGQTKLTNTRRTEVLKYTFSHGGVWHVKHASEDKMKGPNGSKGLKKRTSLMDSCANKRQKDWAFDIDTGYGVSGRGSGFKAGDLKPDNARASAAVANCSDFAGAGI